MLLIKLAIIMAFFVALLVICMLVKAVADGQAQYKAVVRKNEALLAELNTAENVAGLKADFEAILDDGVVNHYVHGKPKPVRVELSAEQKECCSWLQQEREKMNPSMGYKP